jgi:hypothetical protein
VASKRCPTAKVLERLWQRWQRLHKEEFGSSVSKRYVSQNFFENDASALARWTTAGSRVSWRFPLARLDELVVALELKDDDVDDLMIARIQELQDDAESTELLNWVARFIQRIELAERTLDTDEQLLVDVWREVKVGRLRGLYPNGLHREELRHLFDGWLGMHQRRHEEDEEAELLQEADEAAWAEANPEAARAQRQALRERLARIKPGVRTAETIRKRQIVRARKETRDLLKRLRDGKRNNPAGR